MNIKILNIHDSVKKDEKFNSILNNDNKNNILNEYLKIEFGKVDNSFISIWKTYIEKK